MPTVPTPKAKHKRLTHQEKIAAVVLYLKGNWQQHELATQLGVGTSTISRTINLTKASVGKDESLSALLACEFLRPTRATKLRHETRGKKRKEIPEGGEEVIKYEISFRSATVGESITDCVKVGLSRESWHLSP